MPLTVVKPNTLPSRLMLCIAAFLFAYIAYFWSYASALLLFLCLVPARFIALIVPFSTMALMIAIFRGYRLDIATTERAVLTGLSFGVGTALPLVFVSSSSMADWIALLGIPAALGTAALAIWKIIQWLSGPIRINDGITCPNCGYCLRGCPNMTCTECGRCFSFDALGTTPEEFRHLCNDEAH